jgi:hypothetical protein
VGVHEGKDRCVFGMIQGCSKDEQVDKLCERIAHGIEKSDTSSAMWKPQCHLHIALTLIEKIRSSSK